jgi:hypothetical protein
MLCESADTETTKAVAVLFRCVDAVAHLAVPFSPRGSTCSAPALAISLDPEESAKYIPRHEDGAYVR